MTRMSDKFERYNSLGDDFQDAACHAQVKKARLKVRLYDRDSDL